MGKLFSYDSGVVQFLIFFVDGVIISFLWLLCCIPIITAGAATSALYYAVNKVIVNERSHIWREYWGSFRSNFKQATLAWIPCLIVSYLLATSGIIAFQQGWKVLVVFYVVIGCFFLMWTLHLFPHIARFTNTTKQIMINCGYLVFRHIFKSIGLFIVFGLAIVIVFGFFWVTIFIIPALYMVTASFVLEPMFRRYMSEEDAKAEDERNDIYYE